MKDKYYLLPGYLIASERNITITTVLGSCVAVCLYDPRLKQGAINHFIYAKCGTNSPTPLYGDISTEYLIEEMKRRGSNPKRLVISVVGGCRNFMNASYVGRNNVKIVAEVLKRYGLRADFWEVGGRRGRKITFNPKTGELDITKLQSQ